MSKINELIEEAKQKVTDLVERPSVDDIRKFIIKDICNIAFDLIKEAYHSLERLINVQIGGMNDCRDKFKERFDKCVKDNKVVTADNIAEHLAVIAKKQIGYFYIMLAFVGLSTGYNYFSSNTITSKITKMIVNTKTDKLQLETIESERNYWKNKYEELANGS